MSCGSGNGRVYQAGVFDACAKFLLTILPDFAKNIKKLRIRIRIRVSVRVRIIVNIRLKVRDRVRVRVRVRVCLIKIICR